MVQPECKNTEVVENEIHFMLNCHGTGVRKLMFVILSTFSHFRNLCEMGKFIFLMLYNSGDFGVLKLVSDYVNISMSKRRRLLSRPTV